MINKENNKQAPRSKTKTSKIKKQSKMNEKLKF